MKHRERVLMALNHQEADRCPMQISFTPEFATRLKADMHVQGKLAHNPHGGGNTYELERFLDEDLILTSVGWANSYYNEGQSYTDEWGVIWRANEYHTKFGKGFYTEMIGHPLAKDDAVNSYQSPDPNRPELYTEAAKVLKDYQPEYFIVGVTVTTIFETAWALRGLDQLMMDLVLDPDLAEKILDIPYHYHLVAAKRLVELGVDMIWMGDDVGTQSSMMISPSLWRRFFKPRMATFIAELKKINPNVKVAYHSDGVIYPIIPDLIEIGLDVLNPVQPACMDPEKLKTRKLRFLTAVPVLSIALAELLIFSGRMGTAVWIHICTVIALSLSNIFIKDPEVNKIYQALMLLPVLRLINLSMPIFFDTTLYTFVFIYGPLAIPLAVIVVHQRNSLEQIGITMKHIIPYMLLSVPLGFLLGLGEYMTIRTGYLIPDLTFINLLKLTVVMVFFVGLVEELIFRSVLQTRLETALSVRESLLITSILFGLMHSGYGTYHEMLYTCLVGFVMGVLFYKTKSLPFIAVLHGFVNVFLFGILPHQLSLLPGF